MKLTFMVESDHGDNFVLKFFISKEIQGALIWTYIYETINKCLIGIEKKLNIVQKNI